MFNERINAARHLAKEACIAFIAVIERKAREEVRFDCRARWLSVRYLDGDLSLRQALKEAERIDTRGIFSPRNMVARFHELNKETAERLAAPEVPEDWRRAT